MTTLYSYVVRYDSGFAPNPFYGVCTLATCKPGIRKHAEIGDWIVGTGSRQINRRGYLVYAMKVIEALSFEEYSSDPKFKRKKPSLCGSYKSAAGDNIYAPAADSDHWNQLDSYHSNKDGTSNHRHIRRDTSVNRVLVSPAPNFVYFGREGPELPCCLVNAGVVFSGQGYKKITNPSVVADFAAWIVSLGVAGYQGRPHDMLNEMGVKE